MKIKNRIINCSILLFVVFLSGCFDYHFYRFAYQISTATSIVVGCAIMQLFARKRINSLFLYLMATCVVIICVINLPKYTIFSAKKIISESLEIDDDKIAFGGCADSESEDHGIFHYKNYLFEIDNKEIIVFGINSKEIYYIETGL